MKTSLATTLSVIGVLATGGIALAVNTTVLDSTVSSVEGPAPLAEALVPIAAQSVESSVPVDSAMPVLPTVPGGAVGGAPEMVVEPASVQSAYNVQGIGLITLAQNGTNLDVVSVDPVSGWVYESKNERADRLEIKFVNGTQDIKFTAELLDGRVVTAVEARNTTVEPTPNRGGGGGDENENEGESEGDDD